MKEEKTNNYESEDMENENGLFYTCSDDRYILNIPIKILNKIGGRDGIQKLHEDLFEGDRYPWGEEYEEFYLVEVVSDNNMKKFIKLIKNYYKVIKTVEEEAIQNEKAKKSAEIKQEQIGFFKKFFNTLSKS